ncbi:MAG: hypothetical protein JNK73_03345 [Bacteroidia bacterium]|nr:hypothetical protein [Bacteroidia bacterium]
MWYKLISSAQEEGWLPQGTVCPPESELNGFKNDYKPDYPDSKMVTAEDAKNWAAALKNVRRKMQTDEKSYQVKGPILFREADAEPGAGIFLPNFTIQIVDDFISYISKGEFFFWWDD